MKQKEILAAVRLLLDEMEKEIDNAIAFDDYEAKRRFDETMPAPYEVGIPEKHPSRIKCQGVTIRQLIKLLYE